MDQLRHEATGGALQRTLAEAELPSPYWPTPRFDMGRLVLPADAMAGVASDALPAFVPVSVVSEDVCPSMVAGRTGGVITIEIANDLVLRVPGDVPAERAAAVARALRGPA